MQAMDIMLLPSLYEGFPVSVIEWQINGLPCLVSDTISRDCNITGSVKFLPINQGTSPWVEAISNMDCNVEGREIPDIKDIFTSAGFDIETNAMELKKAYFDIANKRNRGNAEG